jgi:hypothetical protein
VSLESSLASVPSLDLLLLGHAAGLGPRPLLLPVPQRVVVIVIIIIVVVIILPRPTNGTAVGARPLGKRGDITKPSTHLITPALGLIRELRHQCVGRGRKAVAGLGCGARLWGMCHHARHHRVRSHLLRHGLHLRVRHHHRHRHPLLMRVHHHLPGRAATDV